MCLDDKLVSSCSGGPASTVISWESKIRQAPFNLSHVEVVKILGSADVSQGSRSTS